MLHKPKARSISNQKENTPTKRIHFDEVNVRETHHPVKKDYGFMNIPEAKTPFFKQGKPVAADELRKRLLEAIDRANKNMFKDEDEDCYTLKSLNMSEIVSPLESIGQDDEAKRREEFYRKRRQYNQSEFTITKQQLMSREIPEPGPSIENWNAGKNNINNTPSSLRLFMNNSQLLPLNNNSVNWETLIQIAKQARNYQTQ